MAYPEGIAQMPGASVWAVLFFFMLFTIGLGSQVSRLVILLLDDVRTHKEQTVLYPKKKR